MFPVFMKKKGTVPPDSTPHYIIARNGIFLKKSSWWVDATVPVKSIGVLEVEVPGVTLKVKPIDGRIMMKIWKFFQAVYKKHISESAVMLHYSETLGWEITIPTQVVSFSRVDYQSTDRVPGYSFIGTMHSHSSFSAFHSGDDKGDEAQVDGIHVTFGDVDEKDQFSMDPEVVINGTRFSLPLSQLGGVKQIEQSLVGKFSYMAAKPRFTIECPELKDWEVPGEWLAKVEHKFTFVPTTTSCLGERVAQLGSNLALFEPSTKPETGTTVIAPKKTGAIRRSSAVSTKKLEKVVT